MTEPLYVACPSCFGEKDTRVRIAIHLTTYHHWSVQKTLDWLRTAEEAL